MPTEWALKKLILSRLFKHSLKKKNFKFFLKRHFRHTYGLKSNHHQLLILAQIQIFLVYRTLSMRQRTKNHRNQGSIVKKIRFFSKCLRHVSRWVCFVQKTRSKNSHAWAPLILLFSNSYVCQATTSQVADPHHCESGFLFVLDPDQFAQNNVDPDPLPYS